LFIEPSDPNSAIFDATFDLSNACGLTFYDAAYLELAIRRALPLATLDQALATAARRNSVALI
jgi:predicted nucleic acid-binding protein